LDVALLALLGATAQQNNQVFAVLPEIHSVTGAKRDPAFEYTRTDAFDIRKVAEAHPCHGNCDLYSRLGIKLVELGRVRTATIAVVIFADINHRL
jgi:hypothetical protein